MDELEVAFLPATGAPLWQPLEVDRNSSDETTAADDGWIELALQFELDRNWDAVASLVGPA